ncbi:glycosyltransferase [bacterium]|nr:glycosyltransferase [bacterium]
MKTQTVVSVIVSTYERPWHLANCLRSLGNQCVDPFQFEVIVTDDGSAGPETEQSVRSFADHFMGRVTFLTQPKEGFRLAKSRNRAVVVSRGKQLVFLDGDCIAPPHFVRSMTAGLRSNVVMASDCYRLSEKATSRVNDLAIDCWSIENEIDRHERRRLHAKAVRARIYGWLRIPMRPRLTGCAFACMREDLLSVNGFDENFVGWGLEDRDLQRRFAAQSIRTATALHRVKAIHQWHPHDATFSRNAEGTANRAYFERQEVRAFCQRGIDQYESVPAKTYVQPTSQCSLQASAISIGPALNQRKRLIDGVRPLIATP